MKFDDYLQERKHKEFSFLALLEASDSGVSFDKIGKELKMSARGVQIAVRRALDKIYYGLKSANKDLNPMEIFDIMTKLYGGLKASELFKNFPVEIQNEIQSYAEKTLKKD